MTRSHIATAVAVAALLASSHAAAQPKDEPAPAPHQELPPQAQQAPPEGADDGDGGDLAARPWADGVPREQQRRSLELFRQGNQRFERSDYAGAVELYRQSLESWDHPAVHGNLAIALIHRDQPLLAFEHIEAALRWDAAPFDRHIHEQLVRNRKLLLGQLARLEVACDDGAARVSLNGSPLLQCPGTHEQYVLAGAHELVARNPGYLTFARSFQALPGRTTVIEVELVSLDEAGGYERRIAPWQPWAVVAGGAAVALVGVGLQFAADDNIDAYDAEIARACPNGCSRADIPEAVRDLESRGELQNRLAISAWTVGAAAIAGGAALVYWNRPQRVRLDSEGNRVTIAPTAGRTGAGIAITGSF